MVNLEWKPRNLKAGHMLDHSERNTHLWAHISYGYTHWYDAMTPNGQVVVPAGKTMENPGNQ